MTLNDLEWLFHVKIRFRPALVDSERLSFKKLYNLCDSAVFCALHDQLASLGKHAQLTRCFSAVAELLVYRTFAWRSLRALWSWSSRRCRLSGRTHVSLNVIPNEYQINNII